MQGPLDTGDRAQKHRQERPQRTPVAMPTV
jgi:hypothetical protein